LADRDHRLLPAEISANAGSQDDLIDVIEEQTACQITLDLLRDARASLRDVAESTDAADVAVQTALNEIGCKEALPWLVSASFDNRRGGSEEGWNDKPPVACTNSSSSDDASLWPHLKRDQVEFRLPALRVTNHRQLF
jgi:hypothetical protein